MRAILGLMKELSSQTIPSTIFFVVRINVVTIFLNLILFAFFLPPILEQFG